MFSRHARHCDRATASTARARPASGTAGSMATDEVVVAGIDAGGAAVTLPGSFGNPARPGPAAAHGQAHAKAFGVDQASLAGRHT
jgi:hypothetical protein